MVNYGLFDKTNDVAYNILTALEYCKQKNEDGLIFDKGVYNIFEDKAPQGLYSMSNHTHPGIKKACFLLKEFKNFTLDGGDSTFVMEDILTPIILDNCVNIKIKGFNFESKNTLNAQFEVVRSGDGWIEIKPEVGKVFIHNGYLYAGDFEGPLFNSDNINNRYAKLHHFFEYDKALNLREDEPAYTIFGVDEEPLISYADDGLIRLEKLKRKFEVGNHLVAISLSRCSANIFLNECKDVEIFDTTLYSGIGMGVIAQNSENIDIHNFNTKLSGARCYSINADATHFVHCKGLIHIHDCLFEGQLDDALNIHSLYLKVIEITGDKLLLKYMHHESRGIDIFKKGGTLQLSKPDTLLPYAELTIKNVNKINFDYVEVEVEGDISDVKTGDVADEISYVPDVIFENNIISKLRSRGMLLASSGNIVVRNNVFENRGTAIKFESDGKFWYESGATKDVLISNNKFLGCKRFKWGTAVIEVAPREKTEEDKYYHGKIEISNNYFDDCKGYLASVNNTKTFIFKDNVFKNHDEKICDVFHCKIKQIDI